MINGVSGCSIDVTDRGFQYGDGIFETIEIVNGQLVFLDRHILRLKEGCNRLLIPAVDYDVLIAEAKTMARPIEKGVLKIIVTRGIGGRGYRQPESIIPTRVLSTHPFPNYPDEYSRFGIVARLCKTRLGLSPFLAGIKHLNRLEQIIARAEWNDSAIQEGLMLDTDDNVIEGTMTNLFYVADKKLHTSEIERSGVAGVMREIIMDLAVLNGLTLSKHYYSIKELLNAEEIFVCNSIIGLWPVVALEDNLFDVGPVTRQISDWLALYKMKWLQAC